jgi:hypothetical protein
MTELWIPLLVTIESALFAMAKRMGQIDIVRRATRMTGAKDDMAEDALGLASSQLCKAGMNSAIPVRVVKVQKKDTGKI